MSEYWFRPHRYGIGATPTTWQGWVVVGVYVAAVLALSAWFESQPRAHTWPFLMVIAGLTGALVFISWRRTKGGWRWRWGDRE